MPPETITTSKTTSKAAPKATWDFPPWGRLAYIDGVRAIAIIAVIGFHAHIPGFRGGFVGVDVFFVISGFLITHQIVSQLLTGRFSAADFYARRILRIFPPLLLVIVVTLAIAPLFPLLPQEGRDLAKSGAATAAMISNYYFTVGRRLFLAAGGDQSAAAHLVARGRGAILPARARGHGRHRRLGHAPQLGCKTRAAHWRRSRHRDLLYRACDPDRPRSPPLLLLDHDAVVAVRCGRHARDCRSQGHAGARSNAVDAGRCGIARGRGFSRPLS